MEKRRSGLEVGLYLRSLEVSGFKTFASPTLIEFAEGITAVVGANGSGKSNLVDALRWGLGEQSLRELRGHRAEDVIFSGSERQRGAAMAEVAVRFYGAASSVHDLGSEAEIVRRVFRSGEGEFQINRRRVRLRDIADLVREAGLAGAHTIVGQGMVDAVLSARPLERRNMIAEVAGVAAYEARRAEALSRLSATKQNVASALALLEEIEPRLRLLKRQAGIAGGASAARSQLNAALARHYSLHRRGLMTHQEEVLRSLQEAEERARGLRDLIGQAEAEDRLRQQRLARLHEAREAARERLRDAEAEVNRIAEAKNGADALAGRLGREMTGLESRLESLTPVDELETQVRSQRATVDQLRSRLEELRRAEHEAVEQEQQATGRLAASSSQLEALVAELQNQRHLLERERVELDSIGRELERLDSRLIRLSAGRPETEQGVADAEHDLQESRVRASEAEARMQQALAALHESRHLLHEAGTARSASESERDRLEDRGLALKMELEELKRQRTGTATTPLGQCVHVDDHLALALAASLGSLLESDVSPGHGRPGLRRAGIPTPVWQDHIWSTAEAASTTPMGWLSDFVELDRDAGAIMGVLTSTLVLPAGTDLEAVWSAVAPLDAESIGHPPLRLVDVQGNLRAAGSAQLAGQSERQAVRRETAISRVEADLRAHELRLQDAVTEAEQRSQREHAAQAQFETSEGEFHVASRVASDAQTAVHRLESRLERLKSDSESLRLEQREMEERRTFLEGRERALTDALAPLQSSIESLTERLDGAQGEHKALEVEVERLAQSLSSWGGEIELLTRTISLEQVELGRLEAQRDRAHGERRQMQEQLIETRNHHDDAWARIAALERRAEEAQHSLLLSREAYAAFSIPAEQNQAGLEDERLPALRAALEESVRRQERSATELQQLRADIERLQSECREDLNLDLEEIESDSGDGLALSELEIRRLRLKAQQAEEIDPAVTAEFEALQTRRDEMVAEIEDLEATVDELEGMLREADREVRRRFQMAFSRVNALFADYFEEIFGGGSAELVLDESGVPEAVDILTRLPGRRTREVGALSGGERTLVAGAFLFALLSVSPPPFCVLDEVDAALDETNVDRYLDVMRRLAERTQFVVVTHNRATMAAADSLYGIVLDADRGSRALSLRLEEATG
ncbi:MAG TPA: chromosome segregation protein SMC [Chloroflexota bacterium]|nr:chromosome segregation protein SMC [Chloroflexota bacterium]